MAFDNSESKQTGISGEVRTNYVQNYGDSQTESLLKFADILAVFLPYFSCECFNNFLFNFTTLRQKHNF